MHHHPRTLAAVTLGSFLLSSALGCAASTDAAEGSWADTEIDGAPGAGGKADDVAAECALSVADPYVFTGVAQGGTHAGGCLDTTMFRAVRSLRDGWYLDAAERYDFQGAKGALEATGDPILASSSYALAANVRHDGEFWVAEIPLIANSIAEAYYLVEEFEIPVAEKLPPVLLDLLEQYLPEEAARLRANGTYTAAHGMMRITFRDGSPVVIKPQFPADPSRVDSFHELVLSVHAVGVVPGEYDPLEGLLDAYATARGLYSLKEKVDTTMTGMGHTIRQWRLNLSSETVRKVLRNYLARSTDRGLDDIYNTVTRNCGSELFESLEAVLGRTVGIDVLGLTSIDQVPAPLVFPTIGRHYPKYAEQGLVGLGVLPLREGEQPDPHGRVTPDQIEDDFRTPTLNEQVADGSARLD